MVVLLDMSNFDSDSKKVKSLGDFLYLKNNNIDTMNKFMKINDALFPNS